ncbi:hypothetical protein R1flu_015150 [Riccia fluitans]|uniref:Uncharacterized protein n=1 Tax=Riccia fluitans TaxID=41844 RepID=A0ABD1YJ82_9MARC
MVGPEGKIVSDVNLKDALRLSPEEKSESNTTSSKEGSSSSQGGSPSSMQAERLRPTQPKNGSRDPSNTAKFSDQILGGNEWPLLGNQENDSKQDRTEDYSGKRGDLSSHAEGNSRRGKRILTPGKPAEEGNRSNKGGNCKNNGKSSRNPEPEVSFIPMNQRNPSWA